MLSQLLLINTGNANAGTGSRGLGDALATCDALAQAAGVRRRLFCLFQRGVIGEPLPVAKICSAIPAALENLSADNWALAAEGIMTTDTRPKGATRSLEFHVYLSVFQV